MNKTVAFAAALYLALLPSYAQSLSFYMDMGDKPAFEGISCVTEETLVNGNKVWDITLTNNSTGIFEPVKAGVRLGLDTYMDKYPDWLYKYFPTFLNCCPTHFYGYMQSPSGM